MRLLLPLVLATALLAAATPAEAAPKIAVVDMVQLVQKHPLHKVYDDAFKQAQQDAKDDLEKAKGELSALQKQIEAMTETNPERPRLERQYQLQLNTTKFSYEWAVKSAVRAYAENLERLYAGVQSVVAKYAAEQGIEIVLQKADSSEAMKAVDPEDFALKSRLRVVVFADARVDITNAVLERLGK